MPPSPNSIAGTIRVACGIYALVGGLCSLAGWVFDIRRLTDWDDNGISIQPNATVCVTLSGLALLLLSSGRRRAAAFCGGSVAVIGGATLFQWLTGADLKFDSLLLFDRPWGRVGVVVPGRMGPPGAVSWTLIGVALFLAALLRKTPQIVPWLASVTLAIGTLSITGYLYGASLLYTLPHLTVIALQTATFVVVVSLGLIASAPEYGPLRFLDERGTAGLLARRVLPIVVALPLMLGWLVVHGRNAGWFDTHFGTAVRTLAEIVVLVALLWWSLLRIKRHEDAQRQSSQRLSLILESIGDAFLVLDRDWRFTFVNERCAERMSLRPEVLLGANLWELFPAAMKTVGYVELRRAMTDRVAVAYENFYEPWHKWFYDQAYPTADGGLAIYSIDITDRKRSEESARRSARVFGDLVEQCPFGIYIIDSQFRIAHINAGSQAGAFANVRPIIGREFGEVIRVIWPEPVASEIVAHFRRTLDTGEPYSSKDFVSPRGDVAKTEAYEWELHRILLPDGQFGVVCYYYDSTKLREVELALRTAKETAEAANNAKDRFLAVLSHELRTPLSPVLMSITAMDMNQGLPAELREEVAMIRRNVELEARLIDDLLDVSRISSGKLRLNTGPVDLNAAVRHVCHTCRPFILEKAIRLHCELPEVAPQVDADAARLQQILWNLLRNAAKFTPEGGEIHVSVKLAGGERVRLEVRDTGIGITPEALTKIFDAFDQGEASVTQQFGGLGLGLAISKALVEMHRGTIKAESGGTNRGATFTVELPVLASGVIDTPGSAMPRNQEPRNGDKKLRLLVVEDHPDTAKILSHLLGRMGHAVRTAHTAAAALALAGTEPFDMIISDIGLPDATGYQLMSEIRSRYSMKGIAMSGYGMEEDVRKGQLAGFSDHIVKPATLTQLESAIRRVIDRE